jgi:hypothetical protein
LLVVKEYCFFDLSWIFSVRWKVCRSCATSFLCFSNSCYILY